LSGGSAALILGIETSCDETAAAVVRGGTAVLSNVVASQHALHERYRGVVPEIASRAHLERILPVVREALQAADVEYAALDAIAVANRPGLIGSLLVGVSAAKALAWSLGKPLIGVDHVEAHLQAGLLNATPMTSPAVGLVVSGGHTSLYLVMEDSLRVIGRTIDDAVGEAFDKVGSLLGLPYPGGPEVDRIAARGDAGAYEFPMGLPERDRLDFSFSGLKTAVLYVVKGVPAVPNRPGSGRAPVEMTEQMRADIAASFQKAAIGALMRKLRRAIEVHGVGGVIVGGGVSANSLLRRELAALAEESGLDVRVPAMEFCVDNAAMIAAAGARRLRAGQCDALELSAMATSRR
jgi:N6-L-threonylcarbamoyladenine synthase